MSIHALLALDQRDEKLREVIQKLTNERDDARRRLCKVAGDNRNMWGEDVAKEYGWDCFKSDKQ